MERIRGFFHYVSTTAQSLWVKFRALKLWQQGVSAAVLLVVVVYMVLHIGSSSAAITQDTLPTVRLASLSSLTATGGLVDVVGTVRSESEANILAKTGGVVQVLHTSLGSAVPAGFVIAEVENASERATVLQAEGAYDAVIAARSATSLPETETLARSRYQEAYTTVDTVLRADIDTFFGNPTSYGPALLISAGGIGDPTAISRRRADLDTLMTTWRSHVATADATNPATLLDEAYTNTQTISLFLSDLAVIANERDSGATATQLTALATARASIDGLLSTISTARTTYRTTSTGATASADASVKQALGALNGAQANLEKTLVRAPIAGTVNFLSLHVGDYVTSLSHVATVAQNGALEIVAYVSIDDRGALTIGQHVAVAGGGTGIITSVSPALNPVTKQIEVHIAVEGKSTLENGQAVHVQLASTPTVPVTASGPLMLPLTTLKLTPAARVVFSVGEDGRLVAHPVDIGEVRGDRIEIRTSLPSDLRIVVDARGLSEGQKVNVGVE